MITITDKQKEIINQLNHSLYTADFLLEWINCEESVFINAPAALQAMGAKGYYEAVRQMEKAEKDRGATNDIFADLKRKAEYALNSKSITLVYEAYGMAKMAFNLKAISYEEFSELNTMLVRNGINNPKAGLE